MEISLNSELMELLRNLASTLSRVQYQYLLAIIPTVAIFALYFLIMFKPGIGKTKGWWQTWKFEKETGGTIIKLVHSQPSSILDMFRMPMISLDDSYAVMRALKDTPNSRPIHLILHTPGGMVIAAEQIARAIKRRKGEVHAYIPQYAMSGGTLIALACGKIHMGDDALLGPLDPQLMIGLFDQYPCTSLVKALKVKNTNREDRTLIYGDVAEKAISQMKITVTEILSDKIGMEKAEELSCKLCDGNWTHDYGINMRRAKELGLLVDDDIPERIQKIADIFPCTSSVQYRKRKKDENNNSLRITL